MNSIITQGGKATSALRAPFLPLRGELECASPSASWLPLPGFRAAAEVHLYSAHTLRSSSVNLPPSLPSSAI